MTSKVPEGWEEESLGVITTIISGGTPSTTYSKYWNGKNVWITPDDFKEFKSKYIFTSMRKISDEGLKNSSANSIPKDSIVMSSRAPIGYLGIVKTNFSTNQGCKSFVCKKKINNEYLFYNLSFNVKKIKSKGEGTTFSEISKTQLEKFEICYPKSLKEQQKIATILQNIDKSTYQTKVLIEKHKKMKGGLMLDVFSKGINNNGMLRKDGGWNTIQIKSIALVADIDHKMPDNVDFGVPFISAKDITDDGKIILEGVKNISYKDYQRLSRKIKPKRDDLIYSRIGTIGRVSVVDTDKTFLMSYSCCVIRPVNGKINSIYLSYFLKSKFIDEQIGREMQSIGVPDLGLDKIYDFEIRIPKDRDEQNRIAERLKLLDDKIKSTQLHLNKLLRIKSGLMQDLLTGKVRVAA